jgi:hypothetical protein
MRSSRLTLPETRRNPAMENNMSHSIQLLNKAVMVQIPEEHGNFQRVIIGGADGTLITIDARGHIHIIHPEGPGDPEVKKAVSAIQQNIQVLTRTATQEAAA